MGDSIYNHPFKIMDEEIWEDVIGFEGKYFISNHGRVKSINGKYTKKFPDGYITIGTIDCMGYRIVALRKPKQKQKHIRIHTLVATAFCEKKDGCKCVNHIDGDGLNNYYKNLEWTTPLGNSQHAIRTGLFNIKGENHFNAKLTKEKVLEMRRLYWNKGLTQQTIADKFGVCRRQAGDVINGVNWGWLKEPCQVHTLEQPK